METAKVLSGKTALVTGGGTGLGRAISLSFAEAGANVVICGRRLERCEEVVAEIAAMGARAIAVACDVSDPSDVERLFETAVSEFDRIDVLVNNAGMPGAGKPFLQVSLEEWERTYSINVTSIFLCSQAAVRHMGPLGGGRIINIGSVMATKVGYNAVDYCGSKGAVLQITRALALELARENILVNAIHPGFYMTEIGADLPSTKEERQAWAKKKRIPLGRIGDPSELAPMAVFLASDASAYMTGASLAVDGGVLVA